MDREGRAEQLELGGDPARPRAARPVPLLLAVALAVTLVAVGLRGWSVTDPSSVPVPTPTPSAGSTGEALPAPVDPAPVDPAPVDPGPGEEGGLGRPVLAGADPGWRLFAHVDGRVMVISPRDGSWRRHHSALARQAGPQVWAGGAQGLYAWSPRQHRAELYDGERGPVEVPSPGRPDTPVAQHVVAGEPGWIWYVRLETGTSGSSAELIHVDGSRRGPTRGLPVDLAPADVVPDGAGGLWVGHREGAIHLDAEGERRLRGPDRLLAGGPQWRVVASCPAGVQRLGQCRVVLERPGSGEARDLGAAPDDLLLVPGRTSPDGRWWQQWVRDGEGERLRVVDLSSAREVLSHPLAGEVPAATALSWSPDGRLLLTDGGRLWVLDPAGSTIQPVELGGLGAPDRLLLDPG